VTIPLPVKSVTIEISVDAGSRYETKENSGLSHFLEHMFFKGTKKRPTARDLATEVDSFGGVINAATSKEDTSFYVKAAAEHLPQAIDILVDILINSKFERKEIEKEKGVIIEEINMHEDTPMVKIGEIFDSLLYRDSSLGREISGKKENIRKIQRRDFLKYLSHFYQPERIVVAIAGGCESAGKTTESLLNDSFASQAKSPIREEFTFFQNKSQLKVHYKKTEQAHFCLGVPAFKRIHQDRYVLSVLATILGGSMSSRLFEEVRGKRGLAYYVRTETECFHETGYLVTQAGTDINKIDEAIKVVLAEYYKVQSSKFKVQSEELKKAKEFLKGRLILDLEDSHAVASLFGSSLLLEGRIRTPEEMIKGVEKVTPADIQRVAKKLFLPENLNLAIIGPYKKPEKFEKILD